MTYHDSLKILDQKNQMKYLEVGSRDTQQHTEPLTHNLTKTMQKPKHRTVHRNLSFFYLIYIIENES